MDVTRGVLGDPRGSAGGAIQTTPTPTKKSKQRAGQKRGRVGVLFRFGIMEPPVCFNLVSYLTKTDQHFSDGSRHLPSTHYNSQFPSPRRACRTGMRSNARPWAWCLTRNRRATSNVNGINAPAFPGATRIASHPPTQPCAGGKDWQIDHGRDEALRVTAPSLTTCNWATSIGTNSAAIAAHGEAATCIKDVPECIPTVSADLQHTAVKAQIRIHVRCFKVEVLPERQLQWIRRGKREG